MSSATFMNMRVDHAEQFKAHISEPNQNTSIYLTYGKTSAWANDASPDVPTSSVATQHQIWQQMIGGKRIRGGDISHVIPRINWTANTVYDAYDHATGSLYDQDFYVLTSDFNVYKCLSNNYSANSTVEPSAINPASITQTSDGYIWKYMFTVSDAEQLRFTTDSYIPVKTILVDDGSLQWKVQDQAEDGAIYSILLTNNGSGYTNVSNLVITITGDGSSATATGNINVTSQTVTSITMTDYGTGYTNATVTITGGGGTGANARAIISPFGGHGSNPVYELGAAYLMFNPQLETTEEAYFPATNDYRQIALIEAPKIRGTSNTATNTRFLQAYTITTLGSGEYEQDEIVYQGASQAAATFSARMLSWDSSNGVAVVINTSGTPGSQALIGANTSTSRYVSEFVDKELQQASGQILYVNNIKPITRSADQTEDFKIVMKF